METRETGTDLGAEENDVVNDNQLKENNVAEDVKDGSGGAVQASAVLQMSQQQPQGAMVCWEQFLHIRSLKVLLVENDDSTRHVVGALLRNCRYEVTEAANGLQAWKILEDLTNRIDLVLTEVVMPCLSGVGLLSKIMSHKTLKNVPVIMMSPLDSMGLVFRCLSKGAVDFLVKPIRKNELKNLWQHVWRRCHSSSGSGSESGTQTQKSVKSKIVEKSDNTGSNGEDDNGSIGLIVGDGSDNGSGTQSTWTKQAVEVDSPRPMSPCDRVAEGPDSTCAQVIHSNAEISGNHMVPMIASRKCQDYEEQLGTKPNNQLDVGSSKFSEHIDKGKLDLNSDSPSSKLKYEAANLTGIITKIVDTEKDETDYETLNRISNILDVNSKSIEDSKELPTLELSLKRLRGAKDVGTTVQDDRNVFRRSDYSAFSRYNTASNANKGPSGNIESASQVDNSLKVTKKGSAWDVLSHSYGDPLNQSSNRGSNNIDMASTTDSAFIKPVLLKNKSDISSTVNCLHSSRAFQSNPQQVVSDNGVDVVATSAQGQQRGKELQIQHLTCHYDNCHHLVHNMQEQQLSRDHEHLSLKKMAAAVPHCGSSNVLGGLVDGNSGNYSVNGYGSASGSNHGSNGQNGSSTAMNAGGINGESANRAIGKSGSGDASGSGSGNRVDQNKFSRREAALIKFRQKRKERCFRKKVRYQSRKRLAEQRPRVHGQFVRRQTVNENTSREAES